MSLLIIWNPRWMRVIAAGQGRFEIEIHGHGSTFLGCSLKNDSFYGSFVLQ